MRCPFCSAEMKRVGTVGELVGKGKVSIPLVGSLSSLLPKEIKEVDVWECPSCGFIAFFKKKES